MDLPIETVLHRAGIEYITLDDTLCITGMSQGAPALADDPGAVRLGEDIRLSFPELVGAEDELRSVAHGSSPSFQVRGICRRPPRVKPFYVTVNIESVRGERQAGSSLALFVEDVTEWMAEVQKRTQTWNEASILIETLVASKAFIENIFDAMAEVLVVTSPEGRIVAANRAALALSEYALPEIIGRPIAALLPEEGNEEGLRRGTPSANAELRLLTKNGRLIPVSFTRSPLSSNEDIMHGFVYLGRDLQETKEAEERISRLETKNLSLQEALSTSREESEIVWTSPVMGRLMKDLGKVADTETTVLITGETGTGKELIAREIHRLSNRRKNLMVNVNCAALPAGLVESELFGHEKGAFTGAVQKRIGKFELADGGSVFLDEVGELPLSTQATLLRVLQEHAFERIGGSQTVKVNVRVIAATNRDLAEEVRRGQFREELLFRLNVFPLRVPPLRERPEDIPPLVDHFIRLFARRTNKRVTTVSRGARLALERYQWPGNVRELANVIERAMIGCDGSTLQESDLAIIRSPWGGSRQAASFDEAARQHCLRVLKECHGVIEGPNGAAAKLGMKPATLRSRLKKLGVVRTGGDFSVA